MEEPHFFYVGAELGVLGIEGESLKSYDAAQLQQLIKETDDKLTQAGFQWGSQALASARSAVLTESGPNQRLQLTGSARDTMLLSVWSLHSAGGRQLSRFTLAIMKFATLTCWLFYAEDYLMCYSCVE